MSKEYEPPILYRVGVLNEFRNNWAYIDYKKFGEHTIATSLWTSWPHRGYDTKEDRICVFLNFEQKIKTTDKREAALCMANLIASCPDEVCGFMVSEQYKLFKALGN